MFDCVNEVGEILSNHMTTYYAFYGAISLRMPDGSGDGDVTHAESSVLWLYAHLLKDFDSLPKWNHPAWLEFGFCFCQSREWKIRLADADLELAKKDSFPEIVDIWRNDGRLDKLFKAKYIDITLFRSARLAFGRPTKTKLGVYQLTKEINHVHRGTWCRCSTFHERSFKSFPESRFTTESVIECGFDRLSP